jgi:predicted short-subunit dehydrogenase-like oxidoreductase (DUF2520 family)
MSKPKIVFIGAGRVATALSFALKSECEIVQVYSPHHAKKLADKLKCAYTDDIKKINRNADIYLIAVKDDIIAKLASQLRLQGKVVVHTSGTASMEVLKKISANCGVLWPLHSFTGEPLPKNVPFCVEASNPNVKKALTTLVKTLFGKPYIMDSAQRAKLHLAAVFANNFTNHMLAIADDIATEANVSFDVLFHLIEETISNLKNNKPGKNQTGPAKRGDKTTMKKHEQLLKEHPLYLQLYKLISKSIQQSE